MDDYCNHASPVCARATMYDVEDVVDK